MDVTVRPFWTPKKSFWKAFIPRYFSGTGFQPPETARNVRSAARCDPLRSRLLKGQGEFSEEVWFLLQEADTFHKQTNTFVGWVVGAATPGQQRTFIRQPVKFLTIFDQIIDRCIPRIQDGTGKIRYI